MRFELRFIYRPKPQPIRTETVIAPSVEEAKRVAKERLDEMALRIAPPPDGVVLVNADTREMVEIIERS